MSPDGITPELALCWARTLAAENRRYVFPRTGPFRKVSLIRPLTVLDNYLVSIDKAVTFGVEIDHPDGFRLAQPYVEHALRHTPEFQPVAQPVIISSGRAGHVHVLIRVFDRTELRERLMRQVTQDRLTYGAGVVTLLNAVRLPGSRKGPEFAPYALHPASMLDWEDALTALRRPLPLDHFIYLEPEQVVSRFPEKRSAVLIAIYNDLRHRGFTADEIWQLRKEPGMLKLQEKITSRSPSAVETWHQARIDKSEAWLARPPITTFLLRRMTTRLAAPLIGRTGLVDRFVELAHYHGALMMRGHRKTPSKPARQGILSYNPSYRQLAEWAGVTMRTAWVATRRLARQALIGKANAERYRRAPFIIPTSRADRTQLTTAYVVDSPCGLDVLNQTDDPLMDLLKADAFRIRKGLGKGPLWFYATLLIHGPRFPATRNERRWATKLSELGMVTRTGEGLAARPLDLVTLAEQLGVAGRGAAQQSQHRKERQAWLKLKARKRKESREHA